MKTFLLIFCWSVFLYSQSFWEYSGEMENPVAGGQTAVFDNTIYIFGGYSDDLQNNIDWIQEFKLDRDSSVSVGVIQNSRYGFAGAQNDTMFYFAGGLSTFIDSWKKGSSNSQDIVEFPQFERSFPSAEMIGDKFYLIGGVHSNEFSADSNNYYIVEYDTKDSTISGEYISEYAEDILPSQQMTFAMGNNIYILGGARNGILKDIYRFNVIDSSYSKLTLELPEPIAGAALIKNPDNDTFYLIGGLNEAEAALSSVYKIWVAGWSVEMLPYLVIEEMAPLNYPRSLAQAAVIDNTIFVFGGFDESNNVVSEIEVLNLVGVTSAVRNEGINSQFELKQNYPNPFNPETNISFSLPQNSDVNISVYSILGEKVYDFGTKVLAAGKHTYRFNPDDSFSASGVYLYKMKAGNFTKTRKMLYLK